MQFQNRHTMVKKKRKNDEEKHQKTHEIHPESRNIKKRTQQKIIKKQTQSNGEINPFRNIGEGENRSPSAPGPCQQNGTDNGNTRCKKP